MGKSSKETLESVKEHDILFGYFNEQKKASV